MIKWFPFCRRALVLSVRFSLGGSLGSKNYFIVLTRVAYRPTLPGLPRLSLVFAASKFSTRY